MSTFRHSCIGVGLSYPKRRDDLSTSILPDGYVTLFCPRTNWAYALPPIAALAWEFLDGAHSIDEVASEVRKLVGDGNAQLTDDIVAVVEQLSSLGLVATQEPAFPT
jgi:hypothetical protein